MRKKWFAGLGAVVIVLVVSSYLFLHADAKGILTGLESKVTEKVRKKEKFQIVEIVPDGGLGEIGCLVKTDGQDLIQNRMDAYITGYLQEDATHQNTIEVRKNYVKQLQEIYAIGDDSRRMTMMQEYEEAYFPEDEENWKSLEFSEENYECARLKGVYEPATDGKGIYEMNIKQFNYTATTGSYEVTFGTEMLTDKEEAVYHQPYHEETDENGNQYMVAAGADETVNLYYIQSYEYKGIGAEGALYAPIAAEEEPYYYVGENGTYQFRMDDTLPEMDVQIGKIYYKFGLESHDWLRTKVLKSKDSNSLEIEVTTIEESTLSEEENAQKISQTDFLYICGDVTKSGKTYQSTKDVWAAIGTIISEKKIPCIIDASTKVWEYSATYKNGYSGQADFIKENVYIYGSQEPQERQAFFENFDGTITDVGGLSEVTEFIEKENTLRSGEEQLSVDINRAFLLQYIIDYGRQRAVNTKESIHVLEIQPSDATDADTKGFELTKESVLQWLGAEDDTEVMIDSMSTAEFIGKKEVISEEYDLVYIGACIDSFNTEGTGEEKHTVYNDSRMEGLIYTHTGDYVAGNICLAGMMDVDYGGAYAFKDKEVDEDGNPVARPYAKNVEFTTQLGNTYQGYLLHNNGGKTSGLVQIYYTAIRNRTTYEDGILRQNFKKPYHQTQYSYASLLPPVTNSTTKELSGDLMIYRYSGNDITKDKNDELNAYKRANYPIVVSDALYNITTAGKKTVNQETVDNTSYMYEFLNGSVAWKNVFTVSEAEAGKEGLQEAMNISKPEILYFDPDAPGTMKTYERTDAKVGSIFTDQSMMKIEQTDIEAKVYTAKIGFYLDGGTSATADGFKFQFYMDLNGDGVFSKSNSSGYKEKMDCKVYNIDTGVEAEKNSSGQYLLKCGVRYRLEKEIPATYKGVLQWKIEAVSSKSSSIQASDIQYTKVGGIGEEVVKVLQITSQNTDGTSNNKIDLSKDGKIQEYLEEVLRVTGLKFEIDTIGGYDFANTTLESADEFYTQILPNLEYSLAEYDMLIIGFADQYYNLYNSNNPNSKNAVEAIHLFIDSGKSVMFSHDTTSFVNISPYHCFKDGHLSGMSDDWSVPKQWGYYMNNAFRNVLAQDRYGVTADTDTTLSKELQSQGALLRQQQHLTVFSRFHSGVSKRVTVNEGWVHTYSSILDYEDNSNGSSLGYFLTRNISSGELRTERDIAFAAKTYNSKDSSCQAYGQTHGYTNATLNRYLVTNQKYLEQFHKNESGKWTQYLNLRNDLLPAENARNQEIYAKATKVNDGLITHYPYEIGDEFKTSKTHQQYYQLNLDQDEDLDSKRTGDVSVWYCLSNDANNPTSEAGKAYRSSKNDVRNNYYVYNIRNVTYTGVGHSELDHTGDDLETKLLVNTIVAAYKAGIVDPGIKILETPDKNSNEKNYEYLLDNGSLLNGGSLGLYVVISDPNLTAETKKFTITASCITGEGEKPVSVSLRDPATNKTVSQPQEGYVYYLSLNNISSTSKYPWKGNELQMKVTVRSQIQRYNSTMTAESSTTLTILKTTLFDLN